VRAVLLALGLFAVFIVIVSVRQWRALRHLARSREGQGFAEFAASFDGSHLPHDVQRRVFEHIQKNGVTGFSRFPVRAEDQFDIYLGDVDDLECAIYELAAACGREKPLLKVWKGQPISTVGDLARFIARLPTPEEVRVEGSRRLWTDE
jgi:hypothetical protein